MQTKVYNYPSPTGDVGLYALVTDASDGDVWQTTTETLVPWVDADLGNYDVPLSYVGGGRYLFTIPGDLPAGRTYQVIVKRKASSVASAALDDLKLPDEWEFRWNGVATTPAPGTTWYYASVDDVEQLIGTGNLKIVSNVQAAPTAIDTAAVVRAGMMADAYFNGRLAVAGFVVPLEGMDDNTERILRHASAMYTTYLLNQKRDLVAGDPKATPARITATMRMYREQAEELLNMVIGDRLKITATRRSARGRRAAVFVPDCNGNNVYPTFARYPRI